MGGRVFRGQNSQRHGGCHGPALCPPPLMASELKSGRSHKRASLKSGGNMRCAKSMNAGRALRQRVGFSASTSTARTDSPASRRRPARKRRANACGSWQPWRSGRIQFEVCRSSALITNGRPTSHRPPVRSSAFRLLLSFHRSFHFVDFFDNLAHALVRCIGDRRVAVGVLEILQDFLVLQIPESVLYFSRSSGFKLN